MALFPLNALRPPGGPERLTSPDEVTRRELYFLDLYRIFEAACFAGVSFSGLASVLVLFVENEGARALSIVYVIAAVWLFIGGRRVEGEAGAHVRRGLLVDVLAVGAALLATDGLDNGIATLFLVNVSAAALLLPPRSAWIYSICSASVVGASLIFGGLATTHADRQTVLGSMLFALAYLASTALCQVLRRQVSDTHELVQKQEFDLANLTQLNDLIIRRMRTGVIVVDGINRVHVMNEAAWQLTGQPKPEVKSLTEIAPELAQRLRVWRNSGDAGNKPIQLSEGLPDVVPRFVGLASDDDSVVIFLDDTSLVSSQAEQLTLSSLGRLAASVAHEVRNPLAAMSYAAQLLAESEQLTPADQRLIDIVRTQCTRMNAIVENILQLSRRERSQPEPIDLAAWATHFVEEYKSTNPLGQDELKAVSAGRSIHALVDPSQLHQVIWNLVQNALRYGRLPDQPARVSVIASYAAEGGPPQLEVLDRGPGIPKKVVKQIFDPFFTTHEHGTGLGLYIARQLCESNRGSLEYHSIAGGGSCFRLTLPGAPSDTSARRRHITGQHRAGGRLAS